VAASLLIVLSMPRILAWRDAQTNALIAKSKVASAAAQREYSMRWADVWRIGALGVFLP
jgi:hypothetical protein